jgi:hypothetical protein
MTLVLIVASRSDVAIIPTKADPGPARNSHDSERRHAALPRPARQPLQTRLVVAIIAD